METKSIEALEQELAEYQAEATRLKAVIAEAKQAKHVEHVAQVRQLMTTLGVTLADLGAIEIHKEKKGREGASPKVPPKYRDPVTQNTWTGRGNAPNWLKGYKAQGRNLDEFLIDQQAE
jgi:DNA-binding protein H-NS